MRIHRIVRVAALAAAATLAGCSVDLKDSMGPLVPIPNVTGTLTRHGAPLVDEKVKLRDLSGAEIDSDRTDARGRYEFSGVPAGTWELRVRTDVPGDFETVTVMFDVPESVTVDLPPADVFSFGCDTRDPKDGEALATPSFFQPLEFKWNQPDRSVAWMNARLYDASDQAVWYSTKDVETSALFNGIGNQGPYAGQTIPAGEYWWRLKVGLADSIEATTAPQMVRFE